MLFWSYLRESAFISVPVVFLILVFRRARNQTKTIGTQMNGDERR